MSCFSSWKRDFSDLVASAIADHSGGIILVISWKWGLKGETLYFIPVNSLPLRPHEVR